ncbi:MAG: hypothetical protein V2I57_09385, partial [Xanthomonadales bacterium]|nr:hypothetical protein [Xanthomonadales bacterium]
QPLAGRGSETWATAEEGFLHAGRVFTKEVDIPSGAEATFRVLGVPTADRAGESDPTAGVRFTLHPGQPVTLILALESRTKDAGHGGDLSDLSLDLTHLRRDHAAWWADYWAKSWVRVGDPLIERAYVRSLYGMAACSRVSDFPPGIFGWVTTDTPAWHGDYHLNYNHLAPFYALHSANRLEQADPQDAPLLAFLERGRWYAKRVTGTRGVLYPVGIGPLGIETTRDGPRYRDGPNAEEGGLFFQQRSNAAYCLVNIAQRWRTTYDPAYGNQVYPLVKAVAAFWEDYLERRDGRYVIVGDAIHEGSGQDLNPILSLGLVRNSLDLAVDLSRELDVDAGRRETWRHILAHLSGWTTQKRDGVDVFRYTEQGTSWWQNNTLGIQHIYPGNALGLDSDPEWLAVAHNTIGVMNRWHDSNGSNSFFPAAVRVGYDANTILDELRHYSANAHPNGFMKGNPHGIENFSTVPNTINEMLCMSHVPMGSIDREESVIRLFPVWPKSRNASFGNIRTWGAFLVSSELKDGNVRYVRIASERGRPCTVVNPWPGQAVTLTRKAGTETRTGERFRFDTEAGETVTLNASDTTLGHAQ